MRRISQQEWENEHMHNPMTEGEALAVDVSKMLRGKVRDAAFGIATIEVDCSDLGPNTIGPGHEILIHNLTKNPLTAHTAASGGEVVGYYLGEQNGFGHRISFPDGVTLCYTKTRDEALALIGRLNRTPPAAVPADALERLVAKWRSDRSDYGHYYTKAALSLCADELAALIPKGADHG